MKNKNFILMAIVLALSIPLNVLAATTLGESLSVDDGGTPDITLDVGDAYIEGTLEVDGAARFDGDFTVYDATFPAFVATDGAAQTLIIGKSTGAAGVALDNLASIMFTGEDDAIEPNPVLYGSLSTIIYDPTDGAEQGVFTISTAAGTGSNSVAAAFMADADGNLLFFGNPLGGGASADGVIATNDGGNITVEPDGGGTFIVDGAYATTYDLLDPGPGAISLDSATTAIITTGADAFTLADGQYDGQEIDVLCAGYGGDGTLTPDTTLGFTNITFTGAGQVVKLKWFEGTGWIVMFNNGTTLS